MVTESKRTLRAEHKTWIAQPEGDFHEPKNKKDFSERRNNVPYLQYVILSDYFDLRKRQIAIGGVCREAIVLGLANVFKDFYASKHDLNGCAAYAQNVVQDTFCIKSVV